MKNSIAEYISLRLINQMSLSERITKDHPGNMHMWWKRSPIDSSKRIMEDVIQTDNSRGCLSPKATIVDPFSGFGGLVISAKDLGFPIVASDLNSVATVLTKAAAEIPARFSGIASVSSFAENSAYIGVQGLVEDIQYYGTVIGNKLRNIMASHYVNHANTNSDDKQIYAWVWTRTAPCPNPACGCRMPLANSYTLSRMKNSEYYADPEVNNKQVSFRVVKGLSQRALQGNKIGNSGAKFKCPACGVITTDEYIKNIGREGKLGVQLMAVGYEGSNCREYISPSSEHIKAASVSNSVDFPLGELPKNTRWFSPPLFGMNNYADLFLPRQILLLNSLCDLVNETRREIYDDAIRAGMVDDSIPLREGGAGALAYSEAVSVYLSMVVDKLANYQSEICSWDNRKGNIRAAFTRQAIPMKWVFAEGNPFSSVTGNYNAMLQDVVRAVRSLPADISANVIQSDGINMVFPHNSILFTELPYYDNVGYADLSDYFYIWMRKCLKDIYPDLFVNVVTSKDELTSIPEHYGGDAAVAKQAYEEGIHRLFNNFSKSASNDYPSIVFFMLGKKDFQAMASDANDITAWENIMEALIRAGFSVLATLPVRTEKPNDENEITRVAIIFDVRDENAIQTTRRSFVSALKRELQELLCSLYEMDMDDWDRPIAGIGCGLSFFSHYKSVINADGSIMSVHDALQVIYTEVKEYISETFSETDNTESKEVNHAGEL